MTTSSFYSICTTILIILTPLPALSNEAIKFDEYLKKVDHTNVTFEGTIQYRVPERDFIFHDNDKTPFNATLDAGREAREKIEEECKVDSFAFGDTNRCAIAGRGSVEINGQFIYLSIEELFSIEK